MKLSKEELISKINDLEIPEESKITLMEDITDSFEVSVDNTELEEVKRKYEELQTKYKERFLNGDTEEKPTEDEETEDEETEDEEVIDIKEI